MTEYWKRWWIDCVVYCGVIFALFAMIGKQSVVKVAAIGFLLSAARISYAWSQEAK